MTTKIHALALCLAAALASACTFTIDPEKYAPKSAADCPGQKACGYKCVPADDPATGCGTPSCDPCPGAANAITTCGDTGACALQCNLGWGDCDAAVGCETKLDGTNPGNPSCGACNRLCQATSSCVPPGYCSPDSIDVSGAQPLVGIATDEGGATGSRLVYYATTTEIGSVDFAPAAPVVTPGLWGGLTISCFTGNAQRLAFCSEDRTSPPPIPFTLNQISPVVAGTAPARIATGEPATPGTHLIVLGGNWAWWLPPGSKLLHGVAYTGNPPPAGLLPLAPATGWRALASAWNLGFVYTADDADGGRFEKFSELNFTVSGAFAVGTGAGSVGAMALRPVGSGEPELYWGDLATGDVIRQEAGGLRTKIFTGSGPTSRMRMVADPQGVYWTDATARTVRAYLPTLYPKSPVVLLQAGVPASEIAVTSGGLVVWTSDGPGKVFAATR